jgi:hypothetical protein
VGRHSDGLATELIDRCDLMILGDPHGAGLRRRRLRKPRNDQEIESSARGHQDDRRNAQDNAVLALIETSSEAREISSLGALNPQSVALEDPSRLGDMYR